MFWIDAGIVSSVLLIAAGCFFAGFLFGLEKKMADFSKFNAALAALSTDINALIAADQPAVDAATAAVTALDATVKAATPAPPAA